MITRKFLLRGVDGNWWSFPIFSTKLPVEGTIMLKGTLFLYLGRQDVLPRISGDISLTRKLMNSYMLWSINSDYHRVFSNNSSPYTSWGFGWICNHVAIMFVFFLAKAMMTRFVSLFFVYRVKIDINKVQIKSL